MKNELQKRLVQFSSKIIWLSNYLKSNSSANHLYLQLVRSATSAALNYGEAQSAESRKDFIHKIGIILKEVKETEINLEILLEAKLFIRIQPVNDALDECRQLLGIFITTRKTAIENDKRKREGC